LAYYFSVIHLFIHLSVCCVFGCCVVLCGVGACKHKIKKPTYILVHLIPSYPISNLQNHPSASSIPGLLFIHSLIHTPYLLASSIIFYNRLLTGYPINSPQFNSPIYIVCQLRAFHFISFDAMRLSNSAQVESIDGCLMHST
jgi:hypothetical protein